MALDRHTAESLEVLDSTAPKVAALEARVAAIARRLFPELKWDKNPVEFRIGGSNKVNACHIGQADPPAIVIDTGLLKFIENEDELAFVIGHEMGHRDLRQRFGISGGATKGEEMGADIVSVMRSIKAGYSYHAAIDFFRRLDSRSGGVRAITDVFDPHPDSGNRIVAIELALSKENMFGSGDVPAPPFTPLADVLSDRAVLEGLHYETFLERFFPSNYHDLPSPEKLAWINRALTDSFANDSIIEDGTGRRYLAPYRNETLKREAKEIILTWTEDEHAAIGDILRTIESIERRASGVSLFDSWYDVLTGDRGSRVLWPFRDLERAVDGFLIAAPEKREAAAQALLKEIDRASPYLLMNGSASNPFTPHAFYGTSLVSRCLSAGAQPFPEAFTSPAVAEVTWILGGAYNRDFIDRLDRPVLQALHDKMPLLGSGSDSTITFKRDRFQQQQRYFLKRLEMDERARLRGTGISFVESPEDFLRAYEDHLFPDTPSEEAFRAQAEAVLLMRAAIKTAPAQGQKDKIAPALQQFQSRASAWVMQLKRNSKEWDKVDTSSTMSNSFMYGHPFIDLLLDAGPYLDLRDRARLPLIPESCPEDVLYRLFLDQSAPRDMRALTSLLETQEGDYRTLSIFALSTRRFLAEQDLTLTGDDFLRICRLYKDKKWPESSDVTEIIYSKIWQGFSVDAFARAAQRIGADEIIDLYRFIEGNRLFPDAETRTVLADAVIERLPGLEPKARMEVVWRLLANTGRRYTVSDIRLRDAALSFLCRDLKETYGDDDGSADYRNKVNFIFRRVLDGSQLRDRAVILEGLATTLNIQAGLAAYIDGQMQIGKQDIIDTHLPIVGVEALMHAIEEDAQLRRQVLDFLSTPATRDSINAVSESVIQKAYASWRWSDDLLHSLTGFKATRDGNSGRSTLDAFGMARLKTAMQEFHESFSSLSMDKKAAILSVLLVPGRDRMNQRRQEWALKEATDQVFAKLFTSKTPETATAESFARAYLETAPEYERAAILAAMMALSEEGASGSVAKGAAKIMSLLGPAYVKMGQAINSHPEVDAEWKEATAGLKSNSGIEPRWETIRRAQELLPKEINERIAHFGPVLGAASFNTALAVALKGEGDGAAQEEVVALIERPHAWTRAENGFKHLFDTMNAWQDPVADKSRATITDMIVEAESIARDETDRSIGDRQYERAAQIYGATAIVFPDMKMTLHPVSSEFSADQVRLISLAPGVHFNDLPEDTPESLALKKKIAKGYVALELSTILSGGGFDCDRHGGQIKVDVSDPAHVRVHLYDFGCLDVTHAPTPAAKKALGGVLNAIAQGVPTGQDAGAVFDACISRTPDPEARAYLHRVRKAWLALQDFQKYIPPAEMKDVLLAAIRGPVDRHILSEFRAVKAAKWLHLGDAGFKITRGSGIRHFLSRHFTFKSQKQTVLERLAITPAPGG